MADNDQVLREAFDLIDKNGNGKITFNELKKAVTLLGKNPADEELQDLLTEVRGDTPGKDKDSTTNKDSSEQCIGEGDDNVDEGEDVIDFYKFLTLIKKTDVLGVPEEIGKAAFQSLDHEGNGFIETAALQRAVASIAKQYPSLLTAEIEDMIREADTQGKINYESFIDSKTSR